MVHKEVTDKQILRSVPDWCVSSDEGEAAAQHEPAPPTTSQVTDAFFYMIKHCIGTHDNDEAMALLGECESHFVPLRAK